MIASVSSGRRFGGLATYLATGRSGQEPERVAWSEARNLSTSDPILAGKIMQAEAAQAAQVEKPVYHIALAFDPNDPVERDVMRRAADRLLADLGLTEHQAVIVAHRDRAHPHVHIMVNRVHPETGVAWDRSFDYRRIEASLRAQERELGVRVVQGKHAALPAWGRDGIGRAPADGVKEGPAGDRTRGEEAQRRRGDAPFVDRVRAELPGLQAARSWAALHDALAERGLRLERKGQGLVIVGREVAGVAAADGRESAREVKASRVHRDLSLRSLERRYAAAYEPASGPTQAPDAARERTARTPRAARIDAPLFRRAARAAAVDVRESRSWGELAERLERRGLRLDRTGYGLAVTDGVARVRFSDVGPEARARTLESRFGQSFGEWSRERRRADLDLPSPRREGPHASRSSAVDGPETAEARRAERPLAPSARYVAAQLARYDRLRRVDRLVHQIGEDVSRVAAARQVLSGREAAAVRAEADLRGALGRVYRDPGAAMAALRATAERSGVAEAAAVLRRAPEQLGALRGAPEGEARGIAGRIARAIGRDTGDPAAVAEARAAAGNVARVAEAWGAAERQRPAPGELAGLARWEERLRTRERNVRAQYGTLPTEPAVARAIARALPRLGRDDIDRMGASLRPSQSALLRTFAHTYESVRDAMREARATRAPGRGDDGKRGEYDLRELSARAVRAALREVLPEEMRQIQRAVQAVHSPVAALRQAVGRAVQRELLGRDGPER